MRDKENSFRSEAQTGMSNPNKFMKPNFLATVISKNIVSKIVNISEFVVCFKVKTFIKFFIYQLIFFYFGIFSLPFMLIVDNIALINNMLFWFQVKNKRTVFLQYTLWLMTDFLLICLTFKFLNLYNIELEGILIEEFYFMNITIFMRSFIIAVRYGYISEMRLRTLSAGVLEFSKITSDLLVNNWLLFHPEYLNIEYESTIFRNEIEECSFQMAFIEDIHDDLKDRLTDLNYYSSSFNRDTIKGIYCSHIK